MTLIGDDARKCLTRSIRIRNTGNLRGFQIILTFVHPFLTDCRKVQKGETKKIWSSGQRYKPVTAIPKVKL